MDIEVERHAQYGAPAGLPDVRTVRIPEGRLTLLGTLRDAFRFGQNDFQPPPMPSVSVGDVILVGPDRYRVEVVGFRRLTFWGHHVNERTYSRGFIFLG